MEDQKKQDVSDLQDENLEQVNGGALPFPGPVGKPKSMPPMPPHLPPAAKPILTQVDPVTTAGKPNTVLQSIKTDEEI